MRLVLLYNLVRKGTKETPRLAVEKTDIAEDLKKAGKLWEEEVRASPVPDPSTPLKLAISLKHEYTEANLDFANLKGRDLKMADNLRSSGAFEVHLALITRHKTGSAEEDGWYGGGRYGRCRDGSVNHPMVDVCEDEISVDKWVDETGEEVENEGLEIDQGSNSIRENFSLRLNFKKGLRLNSNSSACENCSIFSV